MKPFTELPPVITPYITIVHCQNQATALDTVLVTKLQAPLGFHPFSHALFSVCIFWNFIKCLDLCSYHHNLDAELSHQHKETPACWSLSLILPYP